MNIDSEWVLFFSRVVLGVVMIYHGNKKIFSLRKNAASFEEMGFRPGMIFGTIVAVVEYVGGIAVLIGIYAAFFAAIFAFQMIVGTFWKLKKKKSFTDYAYDLLLLAISAVIMAFGPGNFSLLEFDLFNFLRWDVLVLGLIAAVALVFLLTGRGGRE